MVRSVQLRPGLAGLVQARQVWLGGRGWVGRGPSRQAWRGGSWPGESGHGVVRHGRQGQAGRVVAVAGLGVARQASRGCGLSWRGKARCGRQGSVWHGGLGLGESGHGRQGRVRPVLACRGLACRGTVRFGLAGVARPGLSGSGEVGGAGRVRQGGSWQGELRRIKSRPGLVGQAWHGRARLVEASRGVSGQARRGLEGRVRVGPGRCG